MTKKDLAKKISETNNTTLVAATAIVNTMFDSITESLTAGESVEIHNFGKFETVLRPERKGRNPKTGEEITIAAKTAVKFKAGKVLTDSVNK